MERTLGKEVLNVRDQLTKNEPVDGKDAAVQAFARALQLEADKPAVISLESFNGPDFFDTFVRLEDMTGKVLAADDNKGVDLNSLLVFTPPTAGQYKIVATCSKPALGSYMLVVRQSGSASDALKTGEAPKTGDAPKTADASKAADPPKTVEAPPDGSGWKEVTGGYKGKAYAVLMPTDGKISDSEDSIVSKEYGQIRIFRTVCERKDGSLMAAGQIQLPPGLTKAPPKVRQDVFRDLFLQEFRGKLLEEKKVMLGTMAGKEYRPRPLREHRGTSLAARACRCYAWCLFGTKQQSSTPRMWIRFSSRSSGH